MDLNLAIGAQISVRQAHGGSRDPFLAGFQRRPASLLPNAPDPTWAWRGCTSTRSRISTKPSKDGTRLSSSITNWVRARSNRKPTGSCCAREKEMTEQHDRNAAKEDLARAKELYQSIAYYNDVAQRLADIGAGPNES